METARAFLTLEVVARLFRQRARRQPGPRARAGPGAGRTHLPAGQVGLRGRRRRRVRRVASPGGARQRATGSAHRALAAQSRSPALEATPRPARRPADPAFDDGASGDVVRGAERRVGRGGRLATRAGARSRVADQASRGLGRRGRGRAPTRHRSGDRLRPGGLPELGRAVVGGHAGQLDGGNRSPRADLQRRCAARRHRRRRGGGGGDRGPLWIRRASSRCSRPATSSNASTRRSRPGG